MSKLIIFLSLLSNLALVEPSNNNPQTMAFIKSSCKTTLYPKLCMHCLAKFANSTIQTPQELAHVALTVSLSKALYTKGYLLKLAKELRALESHRDFLIVQDCLTQINDSVDQLGLSIRELRRLTGTGGGGSGSTGSVNDDVLWHISNVETWVSTALTDASTCVQSFTGHRLSKLKATIKGKALNVAQVTSNALAIFHGYATKYRAAVAANYKAIKKP